MYRNLYRNTPGGKDALERMRAAEHEKDGAVGESHAMVDASREVCYYIPLVFQSIFSLYSVYVQCEGFAKLTFLPMPGDASKQEQANLRQRITDLKAEVRAQAGEIEHYEKHVAEQVHRLYVHRVYVECSPCCVMMLTSSLSLSQDTRMMRISELEDELHGTKLSAERGITKASYMFL